MFTFAEIVLSNRTMLREAAPDMMVNFPIEIPGSRFKKNHQLFPIWAASEVTKVTAPGKVHVRISAPMRRRCSRPAVMGLLPGFMRVSAYLEERGQATSLYLWYMNEEPVTRVKG